MSLAGRLEEGCGAQEIGLRMNDLVEVMNVEANRANPAQKGD